MERCADMCGYARWRATAGGEPRPQGRARRRRAPPRAERDAGGSSRVERALDAAAELPRGNRAEGALDAAAELRRRNRARALLDFPPRSASSAVCAHLVRAAAGRDEGGEASADRVSAAGWAAVAEWDAAQSHSKWAACCVRVCMRVCRAE